MAVVYRSGKKTINGGDLAYRFFPNGKGNAASIVLVAGWGSCMNDWFALPQELAKLGRNVLLFDNRGIGESTAHTGEVTIKAMADDTLQLAQAILPAGPFVAIGASAGGFIVQHLAIHASEHVEAAVFIAAQGSRAKATNGDATFFKLGRATYHDGCHEGERDSQGFYRQSEKDIENRMKLFYYFIDTKTKDLVNRAFREICKRSLSEIRSKQIIAAQLKMLATADYGDRLSSVKCPAFCIHGELDEVIPPANGEQLCNELTNSSLRRFKSIKGGRHLVFGPGIADGRTVAREIVSFLSESGKLRSKL